jgi:hypothetical protein
LCGAADPSAKPPDDGRAAAYADPKAAYGTYINAVRANDLEAAKRCWVMDGDGESRALDTIVGLWVSTRKASRLAGQKFGPEGCDAVLKRFRREDVSDAALDLTRKRLEDAEVTITGDAAELKMKWGEDDGYPNPAFEFRKEPTPFRKVGGNWKIDGNRMTKLQRGADFFEATWGRMMRDQVVIMNEAVEAMEQGKLKNAKELTAFIDGKVADVVKKYKEGGENDPRQNRSSDQAGGLQSAGLDRRVPRSVPFRP